MLRFEFLKEPLFYRMVKTCQIYFSIRTTLPKMYNPTEGKTGKQIRFCTMNNCIA